MTKSYNEMTPHERTQRTRRVERAATAFRLRQSGETYRAIGSEMDVGVEQARQITCLGERMLCGILYKAGWWPLFGTIVKPNG